MALLLGLWGLMGGSWLILLGVVRLLAPTVIGIRPPKIDIPGVEASDRAHVFPCPGSVVLVCRTEERFPRVSVFVLREISGVGPSQIDLRR